MFEKLKEKILNEVEEVVSSAVLRSTRALKRNITLFVLKTLFLVLSIVFLAVGIVLLGASYVGLNLMLILAGLVLFVFFLAIR